VLLPDETSLWLMQFTAVYAVASLFTATAIHNVGAFLLGRLGARVGGSSSLRRLGVSRAKVHVQALGSLVYMTVVIVPCMLYSASLLGGGLLALAEGWRYVDAFLYVWQDVFSLGPYILVSPRTIMGIWLDSYLSIFVFVITQFVLGFCGGLRIVATIRDATAKSAFGFLRILFIYSPLALAIFCMCQAAMLAWFEGWYFEDAMGFIVGNFTNVEDGLATTFPTQPSSLFACTQFLCFSMSASGIVIQVVGCHPVVADFLTHVNDNGLAVAMITHPSRWRRTGPNEPPDEILDVAHAGAEPAQGAAGTTDPVGAKQQLHRPAEPPWEEPPLAV